MGDTGEERVGISVLLINGLAIRGLGALFRRYLM